MDTVYPASASALARGRRLRRATPRLRRRTAPVTFAEIKEVDEEASEVGACERRRPDVLEERLGRQFAEFRRRRARDALPEREPESPPPAAGPARAGSDPAQLDRCDPAQLDRCDPAQLDRCDPAQLDLCDPAPDT